MKIMDDDENRSATEQEAYFAELQRVCPELADGLAISGDTLPPLLSQAELTAILRRLPDKAGGDAFLAAWYAAGPPREPPKMSAEEQALRATFARELERVCPRAEWTEPPFGFQHPHGLEHTVEVLRSLPDRAGIHVFLRALHGNDYWR